MVVVDTVLHLLLNNHLHMVNLLLQLIHQDHLNHNKIEVIMDTLLSLMVVVLTHLLSNNHPMVNLVIHQVLQVLLNSNHLMVNQHTHLNNKAMVAILLLLLNSNLMVQVLTLHLKTHPMELLHLNNHTELLLLKIEVSIILLHQLNNLMEHQLFNNKRMVQHHHLFQQVNQQAVFHLV